MCPPIVEVITPQAGGHTGPPLRHFESWYNKTTMNEPQKLIGHGGILEMLLGMHSRGKLAHALLFQGPLGVGKRTLSEALARAILEVESLKAHPDFTVVSLQTNDKGDLKKQIGVEQIRDLRAKLQMSSFGGSTKIAVIDGAETMTVAAQNALLKTLEDPSGQVLIILIATNDSSLLPTVMALPEKSRSTLPGPL